MYRITFHNQGQVYELYAKSIDAGAMYAFVEVEDIVFGEHTELVVDPSEEKLKDEFQDVQKTYIPMHAVIRIDKVSKQGTNKIIDSDGHGNITPFPVTMPPKSE